MFRTVINSILLITLTVEAGFYLITSAPNDPAVVGVALLTAVVINGRRE